MVHVNASKDDVVRQVNDGAVDALRATNRDGQQRPQPGRRLQTHACGFPQSVAGVTSEPVHPPCLLGFRSELILPVLVLGQLACQPVRTSLGNGGISTTWGRWRKVYPRFANLSVELF